jgi:hypothetical protein
VSLGGHARRWSLGCALGICSCGGDYWLGGSLGTGGAGAAGAGGQGGAAGSGSPAASLTLEADLVLTGDDVLDLGGGPCRIEGHGFRIRSLAPWRGHLWLHDCTLADLGSEQLPSIELSMVESAWTTIEGCTFDASGRIWLENNDDSTTNFRRNTILDNALLAEPALRDEAEPIFLAQGWNGRGQKIFAGNRVLKGFVRFGQAAHWLIGGSSDQDSNVIIGRRGGIELGGNDFTVRGNYVHDIFVTTPDTPTGNQESALAVFYETTGVLVEHNLLRKGHWVVRGITGEFRYNALIDPGGSGWLQQPFEDTKIHHNLFLSYAYPGEEQGVDSSQVTIESGLSLVNFRTTGIEAYSNTFDGGGPLRRFTGPALSVDGDSFLDSLRNNVFMRFPHFVANGSAATVRAPLDEASEPRPERLGFADYNLFFNPDAEPPHNYALAVAGLAERADAGFALHDARSGGPIDEQVDPKFVAVPPLDFPFDEAQVLSGALTVSQMLARLRELYTPAADSPLVDAGDPADGAGTEIGAIDAGTAPSADDFGGFGR